MTKQKQWNCRAGINGWHQDGCSHLKQRSDWKKIRDNVLSHFQGMNSEAIKQRIEIGYVLDLIVPILGNLLQKEYKDGYNAAIKDFKIPNKYGEKSL